MANTNKNKDQIWFENFMQGMSELKARQEASAEEFKNLLKASAIEAEEQRKKDAAEREEQRKKDAADFEKWKKEREEERKKSAADFEKWKKEMQKYMGGISESNGAMAETMIYNSLEKDMIFAGVNFDYIHPNFGYKNKKLGIEDEYDIVLRNGDTLAIIETKYKVRDKDVTKLLGTKLSNFRLLYPEYDSYKIILGVGGMSFEDNALEEAKENGVGIIKIVGNKVESYTEGIKIY